MPVVSRRTVWQHARARLCDTSGARTLRGPDGFHPLPVTSPPFSQVGQDKPLGKKRSCKMSGAHKTTGRTWKSPIAGASCRAGSSGTAQGVRQSRRQLRPHSVVSKPTPLPALRVGRVERRRSMKSFCRGELRQDLCVARVETVGAMARRRASRAPGKWRWRLSSPEKARRKGAVRARGGTVFRNALIGQDHKLCITYVDQPMRSQHVHRVMVICGDT